MRATWQFLAVLVAVAGAIYGFSVGSDFLYEDRTVLQALPEDPTWSDYKNLESAVSPEGLWSPVARATLLFQRGLEVDLAVLPFRILNIALLALVGFVFLWLLRQSPLGSRRIPAFLAALLLVAHPVGSAAIYHLCDGRATLLALLCMLGSAGFYLRGGVWRLAPATLLFALALGSSPVALWLLVVLAVAEGVGLTSLKGSGANHYRREPTLLQVLPQEPLERKRWLRLAPLLVVAGGYLILRGMVLGDLPDLSPQGQRMPLLEWLYGWQVLAVPQRAAVHQPAVETWLSGFRILGGITLLVLVVTAVIVTLRHPEATPANVRRNELKRVAFWLAWLMMGLPGILGLLVNAALFDEKQVLPVSVGLWGLGAWCLTRFWEKELFRREATMVGVAAVIILGAISLGRRDYYKNDETFMAHWAKTNPGAWAGYMHRAKAWEAKGDMAAAEKQVQRGLMLSPESPELREYKAMIDEKAGKTDAALATLSTLAAEYPSNTVYGLHLADLHLKLGQVEESIALLEKMADILPGNEAISNKLEAARQAETNTAPEEAGGE